MPGTLAPLSTKARSASSPNQEGKGDSQTTDNRNNGRKKVPDDHQEREKANVDLAEQQSELGDYGDEDDELVEARDEQCKEGQEYTAEACVPKWHRAKAVPRARDEVHQVRICVSEQCDDVVAGPPDGPHRYIVVGDGSVFGARSNISTCQRRKRRRTNLADRYREVIDQGIDGADNYVFRATLDQDVLLSGGGCADEGDAGKSCDSDSEEARDEHLEW